MVTLLVDYLVKPNNLLDSILVLPSESGLFLALSSGDSMMLELSMPLVSNIEICCFRLLTLK
jgi:hypothetical protein